MSKDKPELTKEELQSLINIVGSHPTSTGIASQEGQLKAQLINKLSQMIAPKTS